MDPQFDDSAVPNPSPNSRSVDIDVRIADALAKVGICARSVGQYGRSHPLIEEMAGAAYQALIELLTVRPTLVVACTETFLALENYPIEDTVGTLAVLAKTLSDRRVAELKIIAGITESEIVDLAEVLSMTPEDLALRGGTAMELGRRGVTHVQTKSGIMPMETREAKDPADIYEEALLLVEEAMRAVESGLQIPVPEIRAVVSDSLQSLISDDSTLLALTGIRSYDRYLSEHSVNVCILSMVLSKDLGLDSAATLELGISAMLHDVGKVFVPADIVRKPGKLSEEEWQQIRRHPAEGARALAGLPDLPALTSTIALEHHVRADGTGYPMIPTSQKPHLLSRLVAIVDTYDALTTDRPYRTRWSGQQAIAWMLYEAPTQYDRQLLARFAARARLYPLGSMVRLKKGDYAIVIGGNKDHPRRPVLRVVTSSDSLAGASREIDLSTNTDPGLEIDVVAQPVEVLLPYADRLVAGARA
ncbi:MAG: HD-GYP domain-containing protein [Armatimonadetes bacterium]|nr:HD-GYP domain-containing protein [Armatimonadota bacterium]